LKRGKKGSSSVKRTLYFIIIFTFIAFLFNLFVSYLYFFSLISYGTLEFASDAAVSFAFSCSAVAYLLVVDKKKKTGVAKRLGLGGSALSIRNVLFGLMLFAIILLLEIAAGLVSSVTGIQINTNANLLFAGAPAWFYVFAVVVAPINEEIMFRGLMVPRIGILLSSIFFALPHATYDSSFFIEVIAAFIFGVLAGYVYKRTNSLYPSIVAHMLVNLITVTSILSV